LKQKEMNVVPIVLEIPEFNTKCQDASVECRLKRPFCSGLGMYLQQNESSLKMECVNKCRLCNAPLTCIWHTNLSSISTIREILFDLMVPTNTKRQFELLEYILRFSYTNRNSRLDTLDLLYMYHNMVKWLKFIIVNTEFNTIVRVKTTQTIEINCCLIYGYM
jgi:hypothetical protein